MVNDATKIPLPVKALLIEYNYIENTEICNFLINII